MSLKLHIEFIVMMMTLISEERCKTLQWQGHLQSPNKEQQNVCSNMLQTLKLKIKSANQLSIMIILL